MYYVQSFIRTQDAPRAMVSMLGDKTNAPLLRPRKLESRKGLGLRGAKAAPTVALTVSTGAHDNAQPQSFVPFPSSTCDGDEDGEEVVDMPVSSAGHAENALKRPLPVESRRKRCQTPLSQSGHGAGEKTD
jgi:hypothetical protein